ncbi:hypothetical protein O181_128409 [Austropuccinia psidii MF-1]|uniref:Uncharacterized protein n=1 Tax=Austropuccinia psidii MF-1 TaxID=1389203 RepID=A0A9Q3Q832_9BASI|nr:hypothetical protein [Austropuccinia psidii MF-1]
MLMRLHPPPDETLTFPPSLPSPLLTLLNPVSYASDAALTPLTPPCTPRLPSLCLWSALPTCLQRRLPSLRSYSARPTCLQHCLSSLPLKCPPDMPLTPPHTGLLLKAAYDSYAPAAPHLHPHHPLHSHGALKICLRCHPQPPLHLILSPLLTILTLWH